ncbi:alpha/beta hydrolase [Arthrobacter oryzae]|uniref:Alpha/beta hydrolase n=1 Tax=Arthrobacter oryzae TaxID=409290 RepID=A0A3N0BS95_9MICC|nr:alpha/beta hydrolase [Arthrobacter oryzae]RNL51501.1 alpha/beta hydrolase [Arthrobacter oryzae]
MTTITTTVTGWPHVYTPGEADAPVLLMLHGTGGNEHEIASLAAELHPGAGVLAPRGQVQEHGMLRWFRRHGEGVFDVDDVIARAADLADFLTAAREHYSLAGRPVVAVGFSNGANIALATAMLHPKAVGQVVAFSGMYPLGDREGAADLVGSRFLILNGETDPMAPLTSVNTLITALRQHGANAEQILRPGGHGIAQTDLAAAKEWLA